MRPAVGSNTATNLRNEATSSGAKGSEFFEISLESMKDGTLKPSQGNSIGFRLEPLVRNPNTPGYGHVQDCVMCHR